MDCRNDKNIKMSVTDGHTMCHSISFRTNTSYVPMWLNFIPPDKRSTTPHNSGRFPKV